MNENTFKHETGFFIVSAKLAEPFQAFMKTYKLVI